MPPATTIAIRLSHERDRAALRRLAGRDGRRLPSAKGFLVAEVEGELLAAMPLDRGEAFADPFRFTAHLVEMLELRAAQLRQHRAPRRRPGGRLRSLLARRPRPAIAPAAPAAMTVFMRRDGQ